MERRRNTIKINPALQETDLLSRFFWQPDLLNFKKGWMTKLYDDGMVSDLLTGFTGEGKSIPYWYISTYTLSCGENDDNDDEKLQTLLKSYLCV